MPRPVPAWRFIAMYLLRLGLVWLATMTILSAADSPPEIINQSASRTLTEGESATLSIEATGTAPLTYAWYRDGELIADENGSTLALSPVELGDIGLYTTTVSNTAGTETSSGILIDVLAGTPPTVSIESSLYTRNYGDDIYIYLNTTGSQPLTYQWYKDGAPIANATSGSYSIYDADVEDIGHYHVVVTNNLGSATSASTEVRLNPPIAPSFTSQPRSVVVREGNSTNFSFNYRGTAPISFALLRDGTVVSTSTTSYDLRLGSARISDEGYYRIRLSNSWGEAYSDPFRILVDARSEAFTVSISGPTQPVTAGEGFSLNTNVDGTGPFVYQWLLNGAPISTATSSYFSATASAATAGAYSLRVTSAAGTVLSNEVVVPVAGSTTLTVTRQPASMVYVPGQYSYLSVSTYGTGPLTYRWFRDGELLSGFTDSSLPLRNLSESSQAGSFTVEISNGTTTVTSEPAVVTLAEKFAPVITSHPSDLHIGRSYGYALSVSATALPSPSYQWYRNGTPIEGATSNNYYLDSNAAATGDYHVVVTNSEGSATSETATVTKDSATGDSGWYLANHPQHFALLPGESQNLYVQAYNTNGVSLTYQWYRDGEPIPGATSSSLYITAEPAHAGTYHATLSDGSRTETTDSSQVWIGLRRDQPLVTASSGSMTRADNDYVSFFINLRGGIQPDRVTWRFNGVILPQYGNRSFDFYASADKAGTYTAEVEYGDEVVSIPPINLDHFASAPPQDFVITRHPRSVLVTTGGGVVMQVDTSPAASRYQWSKDGEPIPLSNSSQLTLSNISADLAGTYRVEVTRGDETLTSNGATVTLRPSTVPVIIQQPVDTQLTPNNYSSSLYVQVQGSPAPSIQWYRDGQPIAGATGESLSLYSTTPAGDYHAVVTNAFGSVTSDVAHFSHIGIQSPPTVTLQPESQTVPAGSFVRFSVTATGNDPLSYQWLHDGQEIPGAQASSLTLNAATTEDAGRYHVRVSDNHGITTSEGASLVIGNPPLPEILTHPTARTVDPGATTVFNVTIRSDSPVNYQWQRNGVDLFGQTGSSLTLTGVNAGHVGLYQVVVSNTGGSVTSQGARLDLAPSGSPAFARHHIVGNGYTAGDTVTVFVKITYSGSLSALGYQVLLPAGWSFVDDSLDATTTAPTSGDTDLLEWSWSNVPSSMVEFSFTLQVPEDATTTAEISAMVESRAAGAMYQALATPDPLIIDPAAARHTADTDQDGRIGLSELLRVIEIYNTRYGSTRTGRYDRTNATADGVAPDASQPGTVATSLTRFHMADTDRNGMLSLTELLRVIELYNTRSGTTRTGAYHPAAGTADGFAPGSGE